jgi:hypothetical protein
MLGHQLAMGRELGARRENPGLNLALQMSGKLPRGTAT